MGRASRIGGAGRGSITEVADGVHLVQGTNVNWTLLQSADEPGCTLVDTGYRADRGRLVDSLRHLGFLPRDIAAVLITHGHVDHIGSAGWLAHEHGTPVLAGAGELPHLRGESVEQIGALDFLATARTVAGARWVAQTLWALRGELHPRIPEARAYDGLLDRLAEERGDGSRRLAVPGRPVPVATPGHTSGHTCWWLPEQRVMLTGDALVTGHALLADEGPQLVPRAFHHNPARAVEALARLVEAVPEAAGTDVTLAPGHGRAWTGPLAEAVRLAHAGL